MRAPSPPLIPSKALPPPRRLARLIRIGLYVSLGLALLMMWDGIRWFSLEYPQELTANHRQQLSAAARAAAAQLDSAFSDAESSLRTVDLWLLTRRKDEALNDAALAQLVETLRGTSHELVDVLVGTRDGRFYRLPSSQGGQPFTALSAGEIAGILESPGTKGPVLSAPIRLRAGGPLHIPLVMPMSAPQGELALLLGIVDVRKLTGLLQPHLYGPEGAIEVSLDDGRRLLLMAPDLLAPGASTPENRLDGMQRLAHYPVTVTVSRGVEDALGEQRRQRDLVLLLGSGISAVALLAPWALSRVRRALKERDAALAASQLKAQQERELREAMLSEVADAAATMISVLDRDEHFLFFNRAFEQQFEVPRNEWAGRPLRDLVNAHEYDEVRHLIAEALAGATVRHEQTYTDGLRPLTLEMQFSPLQYEEGKVEGLVWIARDISELRAEEARLRDASQTDPLTQLLNRAGFDARAATAVSSARGLGASGEPPGLLTLLYLDLDRFKPVNDFYGHPVGDALLRAVAGRLRHALRAHDLVARLGGDEFAVLLPHTSTVAQAEVVAAKLVHALTQPFLIDEHRIEIGVSIGYCVGAPSDGDLAALIKHADNSLYEAKRAGRGVFRGGHFV